MIISAPMPPITTVVRFPIAETPVIDVAMFRKSLCTPSVKIRSSRRSATYAFTTRMPPSDSASRPVTAALILLRSRKIGRSFTKASDIPQPKSARNTSVPAVSFQLSQKSTPSAMPAVTNPPSSCTSPVPTRFRIPSASLMIRAISTPLWVASNRLTGSRSTCSSIRRRMSVTARCAATPRSCDSANPLPACTTDAANAASASGVSRPYCRSTMTLSMRYLELAGRTRPASRLISISTRPMASRPL